MRIRKGGGGEGEGWYQEEEEGTKENEKKIDMRGTRRKTQIRIWKGEKK